MWNYAISLVRRVPLSKKVLKERERERQRKQIIVTACPQNMVCSTTNKCLNEFLFVDENISFYIKYLIICHSQFLFF